ncbi:PREDICTED: serine/threonine-protein kinase pelle-like [Nicrophorus vespilloides]|uniref:Serine/threonine-protein kinase pelle-like n=1 Tax=Nicrophorus vespilloides TaxID=110193 RepID=A0ABM1NIE8_NICVS|nr:PREDICTED: serine/threonine-protein kinase pelle-like [Nicrophorus vespilloides]
MYIYELSHRELQDLCRILDQNNKWEELGGTHMNYDVLTMQVLKREIYRGNSPSEALLTMWGHHNHTVLELYFLFNRMKHYQAMTTIKHLVEDKYHKLIRECPINVHEELKELNVNNDRQTQKILNVPNMEFLAVSKENKDSINRGLKPRSPLPVDKILSTGSAISCVAESAGAIPQISYIELQNSTNNWDSASILGKGGFGTVFKGTWKCTKVAIKRIESKENNPESYNEQIKQSITELHCLNAYRHDNILPLYGYSIGGPQPCLVYQYMSGGSLDYRLRIRDLTKVLDWGTRLYISIGTARGLQYLHTIGDKPLIHGDIKPANILLDPNNSPKIGDFGLAREGPHQNYTHITVDRIHGTRPYLPDEFLRSKKFSTKVDTYSFGVVLFEIATSLYAYSDRRSDKFLKDHVINYTGDIVDLMDRRAPTGVGDSVYRCLIDIGKTCVQKRPKDRPEMVSVLLNLEQAQTDCDIFP